MFYGQDRDQMRQMFFDVWQRHKQGLPLPAMETIIAQVIEMHPEYHDFLDNPDRNADKDFTPEMGQSNPFLHLGLHIAIKEQLNINQPPGIVDEYKRLLTRLNDPHDVEHEIMECLAQSVWEAQRNQTMPDNSAYIDCIKKR
jgi:hypothetical protein